MKRHIIASMVVALGSFAMVLPVAARRPADPVSISSWVTFGEQTTGEFIVTEGADALGCSAGTLVVYIPGPSAPKPTKGNVIEVWTCTVGGTGTITVNFEPSSEMPGPDEGNDHWNVTDATGDFSGLQGQGEHAWNFYPPGSTDGGVDAWVGFIHYEP